MKKIALIYGTIAGVIIIVTMILSLYLLSDSEGNKNFSVWLGYLTMLVALTMIFAGVKQHRDKELGGAIRFGTALLLGLSISVVAGVAYVASWEIHLALTDYAFIGEYAKSVIDSAIASGKTGEELATVVSDMETLKAQYGHLLFRLPMTFLEIFPVGLLISLVSAALLRRQATGETARD